MMKTITFDYYNWDEFKAFLDALPSRDAAKLVTTISKIEEYGLRTSERQKWVKKIESNLYEIRSKFGSNIQRAIYFHVEDSHYIITHGFTKKVEKTPEKEKRKGRNRRNTYFHRKDDLI